MGTRDYSYFIDVDIDIRWYRHQCTNDNCNNKGLNTQHTGNISEVSLFLKFVNSFGHDIMVKRNSYIDEETLLLLEMEQSRYLKPLNLPYYVFTGNS